MAMTREEAVESLREGGYLRKTDEARDMEADGLVRAAEGLKKEPGSIFWGLYMSMRGGRPSP